MNRAEGRRVTAPLPTTYLQMLPILSWSLDQQVSKQLRDT